MVAYAERFYQRQFITRKITNHHILHQVEEILTTYLNNEALLAEGQLQADKKAESIEFFFDEPAEN